MITFLSALRATQKNRVEFPGAMNTATSHYFVVGSGCDFCGI
jgi:hypothetical protein